MRLGWLSRLGIAAGIIVVAAGTSAYVGYFPGFLAFERWQQAKQVAAELDHGKALVASKLFDPDAAKFQSLARHTAAFPDEPPVSICGEVNGKNRYGAYVGFRRFVVDARARKVEIDPDNPETYDDAEVKMKECKGYAVDGLSEAWQACVDDFHRINEAANEEQLFHASWTVNCEYPASKGH